jgi:hypothetical protein
LEIFTNTAGTITKLGWIIVDSNGSSHGGLVSPHGNEGISGNPSILQPPSLPYSSGQPFSLTTQGSSDTQPISGDPVNAANGAVLDDTTDINIPTNGLPLTFARHYDSTTKGDPSLGLGWWGSYSDFLTFNANGTTTWTNNQGNQLTFSGPPAGASTLYTNPQSVFGEMRRVTNPDGSKDIVFRDKNGLAHTFWWQNASGGNQPFIGKLKSISDLNGNTLSIGRYTSADGGLRNGLVKNVVASNTMKLSFVYGVTGDLESITSTENGATRTWTYNVEDAQDIRVSMWASATNGSKILNMSLGTLGLFPGMRVFASFLPANSGAFVVSVAPISVVLSIPASSNYTGAVYFYTEELDAAISPYDPTTNTAVINGYRYYDEPPYSGTPVAGLLKTIQVNPFGASNVTPAIVTHTYYPNGRAFQTIDPVGSGFVDSLARPGGNTTGFTQFEYSLSGKWLELLKEIVPRVTRVAVIRDATRGPGIAQFAAIQTVAPSLGVELTAINALDVQGLERSVTAFARSTNGGLIVTSGGTGFRRDVIIPLAARLRLPAVYPYRYYATDGGLVSYGSNTIDQYRRAATYVDRILKGEKPTDMPVQAPTKYELVVNLKTAKALGIIVPQSVLGRADEVIE